MTGLLEGYSFIIYINYNETTMITFDFKSIAKRYAKKVSVGVRPSGEIHLGNLTTLMFSALVADRINSDVHLTICDIDAPTNTENKETMLYFKYQRMGKTTAAEHGAELVSQFTGELEKRTGIRFHIDYLSNVQDTHGYRIGLSSLLRNADEVQMIFHGAVDTNKKHVPIYPVCPCCKHAPREEALALGNSTLKTRCKNKACREFEHTRLLELYDERAELGVHYFIDPIRDVMLQPQADVHVFGGDYQKRHGQNKMPGIAKVEAITEIASRQLRRPFIPDYFIGPILLGPDGRKLSKSAGTDITYKSLRNRYGDKLNNYLLRFVENIVREGMAAVPYEMINSHFRISRYHPQPSARSSAPSLVSS